MTKRQARVAAALINASYLAMTDTPEFIAGVSEADMERIITAFNDAGWKILHRYGVEQVFTCESAVAYAIANY